MAATFEWNEDNGAATGSPSQGTTRNTAVTQINWKNIDDVATAYSSSPITAGNNSYHKYQFAKFGGTWNQISNGLWAHTAGALGTGLTLVGKVTSTYATPATSALGSSTDMTSVIAIGSGAAVNFHATGPQAASPTSSVSGGGTAYSQYLVSQLQTSGSAGAGDTATVTLTLRYDEN
jgi:hypothetical protein